jgi:three-Cys-motif partner protein
MGARGRPPPHDNQLFHRVNAAVGTTRKSDILVANTSQESEVPPTSMLWRRDPHTAAKHEILRRYLGAWFPKLRWAKRVLFVDGFAGPGEYEGGEPGSPLIALETALKHRHDLSSCELVFYFIEEREDRCEHLVQVVKSMDLPPHVKVYVEQGKFADSFGRVLTAIEEDKKTLAPALVMVDPFGVKGLPMAIMKRIAVQKRSEILVSFMYESMSRFLGTREFESHLDDLFGTGEWRAAVAMSGSDKRQFLLDLYQEQLKSSGFRHVTAFELLDKRNRTEYYLIHATKSMDGLSAIKEAMWKIDPSGRYQFSDATKGRGQLSLLHADFEPLRQQVLGRFAGCREVRMSDLKEFVLVETPFLETHLIQKVLRPLERDKKITVRRPPERRSNYWGDDVRITFL